MIDYEQRAREFLQWLDNRILQREYTHARMENGRNRELLKIQIDETKQIRSRFLGLMQAAATVDERAESGLRAPTAPRAPAIKLEVEEIADAPEDEAKPRTVH